MVELGVVDPRMVDVLVVDVEVVDVVVVDEEALLSEVVYEPDDVPFEGHCRQIDLSCVCSHSDVFLLNNSSGLHRSYLMFDFPAHLK